MEFWIITWSKKWNMRGLIYYFFWLYIVGWWICRYYQLVYQKLVLIHLHFYAHLAKSLLQEIRNNLYGSTYAWYSHDEYKTGFTHHYSSSCLHRFCRQNASGYLMTSFVANNFCLAIILIWLLFRLGVKNKLCSMSEENFSRENIVTLTT